jgi:hypothetical protein
MSAEAKDKKDNKESKEAENLSQYLPLGLCSLRARSFICVFSAHARVSYAIRRLRVSIPLHLSSMAIQSSHSRSTNRLSLFLRLSFVICRIGGQMHRFEDMDYHEG